MSRYRVEAVYRVTIDLAPLFTDIWVEADSPREAHELVEDEELMVTEVYTEDGEYCVY